MANLLLILGALFVTLFVVVKLAEKFAKPMPGEQMAKLSRLAMILIMVLLVGSLLQQWLAP